MKTLILTILCASLVLLSSSVHSQGFKDLKGCTELGVILNWSASGIAGTDEVLVASAFDAFVSFDVSDPENPIPLDTLYWNEEDPTIARDMLMRYPYVFQCSGTIGVTVLDISDPTALRICDTIEINSRHDLMNLDIREDLLYVNSADSVYVYDISNPCEAVRLAGSYMSSWPTYSGKSPDTYFLDGFALHDQGSVWMYKHDETLAFEMHFLYWPEPLAAESYQPVGDYLYIGGNGLEIYQWGENYRLHKVYSVPDVIYINRFEMDGERLYALSDAGILYLLDISNPEMPEVLGHYSDGTISPFYHFTSNGPYVYIATVGGVIHAKFDYPTTVPTEQTPSSFSLSPDYPNPVSAGDPAQVKYSLPTTGNVTLLLHDALGRELRRISKRVEPGEHAESLATAGLTPGVYYYSILANGQKKTAMLVVR